MCVSGIGQYKVLKGSAEMKHALASLTIGACLLLPSASVVFAAGQPGTSAGVNCGGSPAPATGLLSPRPAAASPRAPVHPTGPLGLAAPGAKRAGSSRATGTPSTLPSASADTPVPD